MSNDNQRPVKPGEEAGILSRLYSLLECDLVEENWQFANAMNVAFRVCKVDAHAFAQKTQTSAALINDWADGKNIPDPHEWPQILAPLMTGMEQRLEWIERGMFLSVVPPAGPDKPHSPASRDAHGRSRFMLPDDPA